MSDNILIAGSENMEPSDVNKSLLNLHGRIDSITKNTKTLKLQGGNYTVTNTDQVGTIEVTTGSTNRTITLKESLAKNDREISIIKVDSGTGYVTIAGTINGTTNVTIELQYRGLKLKRLSAGGWLIIGTIGECSIQTIGSAVELIYTKIFTGTTDGTSPDSVAHGVDWDKIISLNAFPKYNDGADHYLTNEAYQANVAAYSYQVIVDATNINISYGSNYNNKIYRLELKYYI